MERTTDTIAAVATPAGPGAIGILRLSGPGGRLRRVRRLPGSGRTAAGGRIPPAA